VHHAPVGGGADHASRRLHHLLQAGIQVGVGVAIAEDVVHALADLLVHLVDLRQPQRGDEGADQAFTDQVDALGERAAQHGEAHALPAFGEAR